MLCDPVSETCLTTNCLTQLCKGSTSLSHSEVGLLTCAPTPPVLRASRWHAICACTVRHGTCSDVAAAGVRVKVVSY